MQKIDDLRLEIFSFENEIASLQQELAAAGGRTLQLGTSTDPSAIATAVPEQAQQVVERQPILEEIGDAITELTSLLNEKQAQLQELVVVKLKKHRQDRITEGQSRLRAKFSDVEKAAESLLNLFFELKRIAVSRRHVI